MNIFYFPDLESLRYDNLNQITFMVKRENETISANLSASKIPQLIKKLQKAYKEYEEVQKELKKQGKLELLSQMNKANLSA
nr:hypothetical protein [Candidatus Woesearchaeota archaeon]